MSVITQQLIVSSPAVRLKPFIECPSRRHDLIVQICSQIWSWDMKNEGVKKCVYLTWFTVNHFSSVLKMWCHICWTKDSIWWRFVLESVSLCFIITLRVCRIILPMIHWGLLRRIKTTVMICVIKAESLQPTLRARKNQHELIQFETSFYLQSLKPETLIKGVSVIFDSLWATDSMSTQGFISQITISPNFQTSHMIASYKRYVPCSSSASADPYRCDF